MFQCFRDGIPLSSMIQYMSHGKPVTLHSVMEEGDKLINIIQVMKNITSSGGSLKLGIVPREGEEGRDEGGCDKGSEGMCSNDDGRDSDPNCSADEADGMGAVGEAGAGAGPGEEVVKVELEVGEEEANVMEMGMGGEGVVVAVEFEEGVVGPIELGLGK